MTAISAISGSTNSTFPLAPAGGTSAGAAGASGKQSAATSPKSVYTLQQDGVTISPGALVAQLHSQGQDALTIAATTGISVSEVNCYLGVTAQQAQQQAAIDARIAAAGRA